jgi:glycosyltransferase involved in cell wall biosynthesis
LASSTESTKDRFGQDTPLIEMRGSPEKFVITVIVPTKDRPLLLADTLNSIATQSSECWQCIVVDDHSTKENLEKIRSHVGLLGQRGCVYSLPDSVRGANAARNLGLKLARSEYCLFLDDDDLLCTDRVAHSIEAIVDGESLDFLVFDYIKRWESGDEYRKSGANDNLAAFLEFTPPWMTSSPTWRVQSLQSIGGWREGLEFWQDWELHCRALLLGLSYRFVHKPGYIWRQYSNQGGRISERGGRIESWISLEHAVIDLLIGFEKRSGLKKTVRSLLIQRLRYIVIMQARLEKNQVGLAKWWRLCRRSEIPFPCAARESAFILLDGFQRLKKKLLSKSLRHSV